MFATVYIPNFYLQAALRHQPELAEKPVALIDDQETKAAIIQLNRAAEEVGVTCGMTPSQGLARCLQLIVKCRLRAQEQLMTELLLHFCYTLAPYIEATAPGVCTVQFTERKHVTREVERVIDQLQDAGITAQAGIARTPDASFLAAHLAKPVLQIDEAKDFLAPLPIETLNIAIS
jgi:protein ImuB